MASHLRPVPTSSSPPPSSPSTSTPAAPRRSGEPWTTSDFETIVRVCREREGPTVEVIAQEVERSPGAVRAQLKKLLPLDQRGGPIDLVPAQLRRALLADEDYDWQGHLVATPPPAPVVEHVHPPAVLTGIRGLGNDELLAMARAMAALAVPDRGTSYLPESCAHEVARRGLAAQLEEGAAEDARERARNFLDHGYQAYGPTDCWARGRPHPLPTWGEAPGEEPAWGGPPVEEPAWGDPPTEDPSWDEPPW